jgi:hypothetical protein
MKNNIIAPRSIPSENSHLADLLSDLSPENIKRLHFIGSEIAEELNVHKVIFDYQGKPRFQTNYDLMKHKCESCVL